MVENPFHNDADSRRGFAIDQKVLGNICGRQPHLAQCAKHNEENATNAIFKSFGLNILEPRFKRLVELSFGEGLINVSVWHKLSIMCHKV